MGPSTARSFRLLLSILSGAASGLGAVLLSSIMMPDLPMWGGEAFTAGVSALVWMAAGLALSQDRPESGFVLFVSGAGCAWLLARGIVHSTSPYYGLFSYFAACVTGSAVWVGWAIRTRVLPVATAATSVAVLLLPILSVLTGSGLGLSRRLEFADGSTQRVSYLPPEAGVNSDSYVWFKNPPIAPASTSTDVHLDADPGSPGESMLLRLERVSDSGAISVVCLRIEQRNEAMIQSEIERGFVPGFIAGLPLRTPNCRAGSLWRISS